MIFHKALNASGAKTRLISRVQIVLLSGLADNQAAVNIMEIKLAV